MNKKHVILNHIHREVKDHLNSVIDVLKEKSTLGNKEHQSHHKSLLEGVELVLNILKTEPLSRETTTAWLMTLDYEELVFAKEKALSLIEKIDQESEVLLWTVFSRYTVSYHYKTFEEASKKMMEILTADIKNKDNKINMLKIDKTYVKESEVNQYLMGE